MDTEPPGEGKAMGGAVGAAMGVASGASLGAAAASLIVPGVGPVIAGGLLGAAILGLGGTVAGMTAGEAIDERLAAGLPHDELFLYEDALRKGRSVVVALAEDGEGRDRISDALAQSGAESIDAARESWWLEVKPAEETNYQAKGRDFQRDELSYRRGFEAALSVRTRGKTYEQAKSELDQIGPAGSDEEAFRQGFERGRGYQRNFEEKHKT
jgi:hypothetical protein